MLVCNTFRKRELEKYYLEQFSDNRISGIVYTFLPSFPDEAVRLSARIPLALIGEKRGSGWRGSTARRSLSGRTI